MIEKERKFLPKKSFETKIEEDCTVTISLIEQGYLMLEEGKQLRVRIINQEKGFITYKVGGGVERLEYEFEIPLQEAQEMMSTTNVKLKKQRTSLHYYMKGIVADIDYYPDGMIVVEIEYESDELKPEDIPHYCGKEVTGDSFYSNIEIAKRNQK